MTAMYAAQAEQHALERYPEESCGLVVADGASAVYVPCRNVAPDPTAGFSLSATDYAAAEDRGEILLVVHSHPNASAMPSEADRVACEESGLPWRILSVMPGPVLAGSFDFSPSGYQLPYCGRTFHHGVVDCYTLIRDFYLRDLGVALPNYPRVDGWWDDGVSNLYLDNFEAAGFEPIGQYPDRLEVGDVILMQIRSKNRVPNHAGVYLGGGRMLHHMAGRLSTIDVYGGVWRESTILVVRRKGAT